MKKKNHKFIVTVRAYDTRRGAEIELLSIFASRKPDHCELSIQRSFPKSLQIGKK